MYQWLLFLHIGAVLTFMLAHGVQVMVTLKKRWEPDPARNLALFDALPSVWPLRLAAVALVISGFLLVLFLGVWNRGWVWLSLLLLGAIWLTMWRWGAAYYNLMQDTAERAIAAKDTMDEAATLAEFENARLAWHPLAMTITGIGGVAVILWLMIFKPF